MRLIDGIKLEGNPAEIPDCVRDDLPEFFVKIGYKVGAEIGVYQGEFTEKFCQKGLLVYGIDPWISYDGGGRSERRTSKQNSNHEIAQKRLSQYKNCTIIRKTSMEAVEDFEDESLDFVYIDGDHRFRYIAEDLYEWTKKIKKGGCISGHDYFYNTRRGPQIWHVAHVLNAYTQAYYITNWFVLGRKRPEPGEKRDKWRSWMFIKE